MTRRVCLLNLWLLILGAFGAFDVLASTVPQPVYVPLVRQSAPAVAEHIPPPGVVCFMQQGTTSRYDPRTSLLVINCESSKGKGQVVWTVTPAGPVLLLEHAQAGSGSLNSEDGAIWLTVLSDENSVWRYLVPTP
jgi:hypothetical protein